MGIQGMESEEWQISTEGNLKKKNQTKLLNLLVYVTLVFITFDLVFLMKIEHKQSSDMKTISSVQLNAKKNSR